MRLHFWSLSQTDKQKQSSQCISQNDTNVLELESSDGCTTLLITKQFETAKMVSFMVYL